MAILFDLDGTLVDSAHDFITALRKFSKDKAKPTKVEITYENLSPWVSFGSRRFLEAAYDEVTDTDVKDFLVYYRATNFLECRLYHGIDEILDLISHSNKKWGVVTNKPEYLTTPLIERMSDIIQPHIVVSGDTLDKAKPHPDPILHACSEINVPAKECLYIGDAKRDIVAGNSAGMPTIAALYGYIPDLEEAKSKWPTPHFVNSTSELKSKIKEFLEVGAL